MGVPRVSNLVPTMTPHLWRMTGLGVVNLILGVCWLLRLPIGFWVNLLIAVAVAAYVYWTCVQQQRVTDAAVAHDRAMLNAQRRADTAEAAKELFKREDWDWWDEFGQTRWDAEVQDVLDPCSTRHALCRVCRAGRFTPVVWCDSRSGMDVCAQPAGHVGMHSTHRATGTLSHEWTGPVYS